jgi:hypothetical protein
LCLGLENLRLTINIDFILVLMVAGIAMAANDNKNPNQRGSLVALGVVVFLFVIGWILAHELYTGAKMEDCVMSGRTNCAPIETQSR